MLLNNHLSSYKTKNDYYFFVYYKDKVTSLSEPGTYTTLSKSYIIHTFPVNFV